MREFYGRFVLVTCVMGRHVFGAFCGSFEEGKSDLNVSTSVRVYRENVFILQQTVCLIT